MTNWCNLLKVFSLLGSRTNVKVSFQTGSLLFILVSVFFFPHGLSRTCNWTYEFGALTAKIIIVEYGLGKFTFKKFCHIYLQHVEKSF